MVERPNNNTGAASIEAAPDELETLRAAMRAGKAPEGLCLAVEFLVELATDTGADVLGSEFANDGARHLRATLAALDAARVALRMIEATAYQMAREDARWHADNLKAWRDVDASLVPGVSE